ncbi:hypothetical protein A6769_38165 [Nostoc punctiforme NIES-2108]|uniref:Uncharacterized protein n=3 Tax=Nostoc punctiforme TaxID=272131 RepID=B2ITD2_NOSP7|nr:hypothetical protein Npun_R2609 [Nostoc punctiforme PCC 73102]RCJ42093.1 hypothetical protein A6769_38165 [Nostoc punctiforme NIES-2108]
MALCHKKDNTIVSRVVSRLVKTQSVFNMSKAYFDSAGGLVAFGSYEQGDFLIKNALLLVEGTQKDNKGRVHEFPSHRVQQLTDNTNAAFDSGVEIPLMIDHAKTLVNPNGGFNKLGKLHSRVEGRIIQERDLPNPKMRDLIGKFGMFGKFYINHYVDEVRKGLIKPLSPGIDLDTERIAEVSSVAFPAIHGPALFRADDGGSRAYFNLSYAEAKEQQGRIARLKGEAQECFDILFRVIGDIESADGNDMIGITPDALRLKAVDDFYADLLELLGLDQEPAEMVIQEPQPIKIDPYQQMPQEYVQQYSEDEGDNAEFTSNTVTLKRRRRK